jgi:hypothetical protein
VGEEHLETSGVDVRVWEIGAVKKFGWVLGAGQSLRVERQGRECRCYLSKS